MARVTLEGSVGLRRTALVPLLSALSTLAASSSMSSVDLRQRGLVQEEEGDEDFKFPRGSVGFETARAKVLCWGTGKNARRGRSAFDRREMTAE